MKKYRIAFCGVFDLANYGDHLFPIVFEAEMKKRNLEYEMELFSPLECQQAFEGIKYVHSLRNLEKMHLLNPYDAFVIAGGEVVHLFRSMQKTKADASDFESYTISDVWLIPAILANKYNVKLIWNCPGILLKFENSIKKLVKDISQNIDYLSVRNVFSKECLLDCGVENEKISVIPDTALALKNSIDTQELNHIRERVLPFSDKYVVYHCNKHITEKQIEISIQCLNKLKMQGYKIVLVPIAYTHGDKEVLSKLNTLSGNQFFEFDKILSLTEMISVLSGCELYIGVSFHGAITALQYQKKAIALDYMKYDKTKNLFEYFNISQNYILDENLLEQAIDTIMSSDETIDLSKAQEELKQHFDNVFEIFVNNEAPVSKNQNFVYDISQTIADINASLAKYNYENGNYIYQISNLEKLNEEHQRGLAWYRDHENDTQKYVESLKQEIDSYQNGLSWYQKHEEETQKFVEGLKERITTLEQGIVWHQEQEQFLKDAITMKEDDIKKEKEKQNELQAKIFEMENSFSWKATKILRKKR